MRRVTQVLRGVTLLTVTSLLKGVALQWRGVKCLLNYDDDDVCSIYTLRKVRTIRGC